MAESQPQQQQTKGKVNASKIDPKKGFDYSRCNFECRIKKKKMFGTKTKYVYMSDNMLILCNEPYKKQPDLIIEFQPEMKVCWVYDEKKPTPTLRGLNFVYENQNLQYRGDEVVMQRLKESFAKYVFQFRFQDEYEVIAQIGKGNYARVFSIQHRGTGQTFACKCFERKKILQMDKGIQSLYNEMKIMRKLTNHPNVVRLHEVFEGENTFYFVMELSQGRSLYEEIKRHAESPFADDHVKMIIKGLLAGISYCSENKVMHRDLKPENLLFNSADDYKRLQIVDFGLAAFEDEAPYIFPKCGTPGFVAPEIANLVDKQSQYSSICDMFSVGVIFHILLTGEAVFPGKKFNDVLKKNKACKISLEGPLYDFLPLYAKELLALMLQQEPSKRISAKEALQHPYFSEKPLFKKAPSVEEKLNEMEELDVEPREREKSMFIKPKRVPYDHAKSLIPQRVGAEKSAKSQQQQHLQHHNHLGTQDDDDGYTNGSFITRDVLFTGARKDIANGNDVLITQEFDAISAIGEAQLGLKAQAVAAAARQSAAPSGASTNSKSNNNQQPQQNNMGGQQAHDNIVKDPIDLQDIDIKDKIDNNLSNRKRAQSNKNPQEKPKESIPEDQDESEDSDKEEKKREADVSFDGKKNTD